MLSPTSHSNELAAPQPAYQRVSSFVQSNGLAIADSYGPTIADIHGLTVDSNGLAVNSHYPLISGFLL